MGNINVLPTDISNKIAAGEVVERPASVVKELVENAIDAGASVINVEIRKGGITLISVSDNGCGMTREDAAIAFLRHATSKIRTENDLDAIYTMGFRGEALSSIGAVSQTEMYTKRKDDDSGTRVVCNGGEIESCEDAGAPNGTAFLVHNLFYNTPARMNFLKKDATEAAAVTDMMERFILSHPEISFRYTVDGKEKYFTSGDNSLVNCIYTVYGKNYAKSVIPIDYQTELLKITGVIGKGDAARPNRGYQSFFVNKRYIKSLRISAALENAYKNQIMIGKHPMAVLNIEINPRHVNINVHPTKLEVKFSREEEVISSIYHAVENALYALPNVPQIEHKTPVKTTFTRDKADTSAQVSMPTEVPKAPPSGISWQEAKSISTPPAPAPKAVDAKTKEMTSYALDATNEYFTKKQAELISSGKAEEILLEQKVAEDFSSSRKISYLTQTPQDMPSQPTAPAEDAADAVLPETTSSAKVTAAEALPAETPSARSSESSDKWGFDRENVRIIGQIFGTYILAQSGDTMIIADQHAAHERLKYEELKRELAEREVTSQMLLVPVTVDLSAGEYVTYCENAVRFAEMGFEIEDFGSNTLLVRATPEALDEDELKDLVIELIDRFAENSREIISSKMERALYTIACKAAVKANHSFDLKQLEVLLNAVLDLENINTCPHGRPIIITMTKKELEKEFKRIV